MLFARSKGNRQRRAMAEINVVPYVDVMLVLLVIFMITTPLLTQGVHVDLPKAQSKVIESNEQLPIVVSVNDKGEYYLNIASDPNKPINPKTLAYRVAAELQLAKQAGEHRQVMVKGDKHVMYDKVMTVMAILQKAGAEHLGLVTKNYDEEKRA